MTAKTQALPNVDGVLEDWYYQEYLKGQYIYWGNVYYDAKKRFPDGTWIYTSHIPNFDKNAGEGDVVRTLNSSYQLGRPAKMDMVK